MRDDCLDVAEHLILQVANARDWLPKVRNAGSVFLGAWSPETMGDYCSGTNHVLPTYGFAKAYSGLSLHDFLKRMTVQELTPEIARNRFIITNAITNAREVRGVSRPGRADSPRRRRGPQAPGLSELQRP